MNRLFLLSLFCSCLFLTGGKLFAQEKDYKDYTDKMIARIIPDDPATIAISKEIMEKAKADSAYREYIKKRIFTDPNEDTCWFLFGNFVGKDLPGKNDLIEKVLYHKFAILRALAITPVAANSLTEKVLPRLKEMATNDESEIVRNRALDLIKRYEKYAPRPVQAKDYKDYTDKMLARIVPDDPATIAIGKEIMQKAEKDSAYLEYIINRIMTDSNDDTCFFLLCHFIVKDLPGKNDLIEKVLYHKSANLRASAIISVAANSLTEKVLPRLKEMSTNDESEMVRNRALDSIKRYEKYASRPVQK